MSAPQPPNQPWQGGQPPQHEEGGEPQESGQNPALTNAGPTQAIQPGQPLPPHGGQTGADGVERTQAIQPGQQPPAGPDSGATQVVPPGSFGQQQPQQDSGATQMVPPGSMPPQQPPYAPPPGADAGGFGQQQHQQGFGQQPPPGYPQQQQGFGQQPPPGYPPQQQQGFGQQPPPGYPPQGGFAQQQGLGHGPQFGGQGQNTQMIAWAIAGLVAILGLVCAIWAISDDIFSGDLGDYADEYDAAPAERQESGASPGLLYLSTILITVSGLAAVGAGVLIFLKHKLATIVTVAAGGALLVFSILYMIGMAGFDTGDIDVDWPFSNVKIFALISGILIGAAGALGFFPQTKQYLGVGSVFGPPGGGGYGPPPGGGFGQQQQPQQGFGPPPPQQGFGQQPPPQQGFGPPPQQGGPPPQQW